MPCPRSLVPVRGRSDPAVARGPHTGRGGRGPDIADPRPPQAVSGQRIRPPHEDAARRRWDRCGSAGPGTPAGVVGQVVPCPRSLDLPGPQLGGSHDMVGGPDCRSPPTTALSHGSGLRQDAARRLGSSDRLCPVRGPWYLSEVATIPPSARGPHTARGGRDLTLQIPAHHKLSQVNRSGLRRGRGTSATTHTLSRRAVISCASTPEGVPTSGRWWGRRSTESMRSHSASLTGPRFLTQLSGRGSTRGRPHHPVGLSQPPGPENHGVVDEAR